ncbi:Methylated-DNA--protein-cysteine methyltransferase [Rahnella aquatilis]|nr:Methylated-DNA--protein-cysteine methyltransferase [Rahnella aquatilis]
MENRFKRMASPVGLLTLAAKGDKLTAILWECEIDGRVPLGDMIEDPSFPILLKTEQQLNEYFAGKRTRFELELDFTGTEFQKEVWRRCWKFRLVKRAATARSPVVSVARKRFVRWARPMAATRFLSWRRVTG